MNDVHNPDLVVPQTLDLYTVAETAAILSVSTKSVYTWVKEGALQALRLGPGQRHLRIRRTDLEDFITRQNFPPPGTAAQHD